MKPKKIPRAIEEPLLNKLKETNPDINKALKQILFADSGVKSSTKDKELSDEQIKEIWRAIQPKVDILVSQAIEDAKRGYR